MAVIPLNIPDAQVSRFIEALAIRGGYDPDIHGPNKNRFAKDILQDVLKSLVLHIEAGVASNLARDVGPPDITVT